MSKDFFDLTPEVFRTLAENSVDAIVIGDLEGKMTYGNGACYELFGYDHEKEEIRGLPIATFWPEEDIPLLSEEVLPQAMAGGWRGEVRLKRKDGGLFDAYLAMFGLTDEAGQPMGTAAIIRDITERKRVEAALQESERGLRTILDSIQIGVAVIDAETHVIVDVNPAAIEMIGAPKEKIVGHVCHRFICPAEEGKCPITDLEQTVDKSERVLINANGESIPILKTVTTMILSGRRHLIECFLDITERKRAEAEIHKLSQFMETIIDNANVWLDVLDEKANVLIWNKAAEEISGYSRDEVVGHGKIWEWLYPDEEYRNEITATAANIIERGEVVEGFETTIRCKDGQTKIISWNSRNLVDEKGALIGSVAIGRDITARKPAEEALAEERNLLRTIIDNLPHYIYVKDTESRYVVSNIAHMRVLGATKQDEVIGKSVFDLYPQELAEQYYADDQEVIRSGQPLLDREERSVDHMGNMVWDLTTKVPLRDSEGKIVGLVGIARDITERKRTQEVIEAQRQALRELSTPIVPVLEGVLVLPLVGSIDTRRAQQVMETLLDAIGGHQAEVVIIDITGVPVVDTGVANHLLQVTRAAALLGAECVLVGISPDVAQTIVSLGVDLSGIATKADLQAGIEHALEMTGKRIVSL